MTRSSLSKRITRKHNVRKERCGIIIHKRGRLDGWMDGLDDESIHKKKK
jgi:hypothetical protein